MGKNFSQSDLLRGGLYELQYHSRPLISGPCCSAPCCFQIVNDPIVHNLSLIVLKDDIKTTYNKKM